MPLAELVDVVAFMKNDRDGGELVGSTARLAQRFAVNLDQRPLHGAQALPLINAAYGEANGVAEALHLKDVANLRLKVFRRERIKQNLVLAGRPASLFDLDLTKLPFMLELHAKS